MVLNEGRTVERVQIESSLGTTLPQPEVIRVLGSISRNHNVIGDCEDLLTTLPDSPTVTETVGVAVEADFVGDIETRKLRTIDQIMCPTGVLWRPSISAPRFEASLWNIESDLPPRGSDCRAMGREPTRRYWLIREY